MTEIRSIDLAGVDELAARLTTAADCLESRRSAVDVALREAGSSSWAAGSILGVGRDVADAGQRVAVRVRDIRATEARLRRFGEQGPMYPRPDTRFATAEQARAAGASLAAVVSDNLEYSDDDMYAALVALGRDAGDPEFVRGFFDRLGHDSTVVLPMIVQDQLAPINGVDGAVDGWANLMRALGTAFKTGAVELDDVIGYMDPQQLSDLLVHNDFDDEVTVELGVRALDLYARGIKMGSYDPGEGLMWELGDPDVAAAVLTRISDAALDELLFDEWWRMHEGVDFFLEAGLTRAAPDDMDAAFRRVVRRVALADRSIGRDEVQVALAEAASVHLQDVADWAASIQPGANAVQLEASELVDALTRMIKDNDVAFDALHGGAAAFTSAQLPREGALQPFSVETERVGAVYGLLSAAHAELEMSKNDSAATLWTLGSTALVLVPTPAGLVLKLSVAAAKAGAGAFAKARADDARSSAARDAAEVLGDGRAQGLLLLAASLYEADRAALADSGRTSMLAPPAELLRHDGSMLPFGEIDSESELAAFVMWANSPEVREAVNAVDDEFLENFARVTATD
jgi:hypothetical protein